MLTNETPTERWQFPPGAARIPLTEYDDQRHGRLISCSRLANGIDPLDFLRQARGRERCYWSDGRGDIAFAGMGVAANLIAWGDNRFQGIERQARALFANAIVMESAEPLAAPRLFGGFAFRQDFALDNTWSAFNPAHFILPHYQLVRHAGQTWLTINMLLPPDEPPGANLPQLQEALNARYAVLSSSQAARGRHVHDAPACAINYPMPYDAWERSIREAVRRFRTSELAKVVLARVCEVRMDAPVDVDAALAYLNEQYADCYVFLFEPRPQHAFFGATPELLTEVRGRTVMTMGLAGSIQRGADQHEDDALARELLHSAKDRHEHALVVEAIRRNLEPLTIGLHIPGEPVILRLRNIQHLHTPIQGILRRRCGVLPLVDLLHPTPALGGVPRDLALDFIREAEPAARGWYAAPVGWIDHHLDGAFGVAIRSAVAQDRRVWLYAGAGIVADSQPEKEWVETGWKFRPILEALGVRQDR